MSIIDSRVVEMIFDASKFIPGINQSITSLGNLNKSIDNATKNDNFATMASSVENISSRFSTLGIIGVTALQDIVHKGVDFLLNKLEVMDMTVTQISAGWQKYAEKTEAVQTIMAATSQTWEKEANAMAQKEQIIEDGFENLDFKSVQQAFEDMSNGVETSTEKLANRLGVTQEEFTNLMDTMSNTQFDGSQMDYVSSKLERLNLYTDETSYNFVDMTSNIGKFTSAGVSLDDAATAMQGIANWAAVSGANAATASRAMYNISQAMGTGAMKLIDWKSIENANMATQEFKQTALQTALAMGKLTKAADGSIQMFDEEKNVMKTLADSEEKFVTQFKDTLVDGWFDADVMNKTFNAYGEFSNKLMDISEESGITVTQLKELEIKMREAGGAGAVNANNIRKFAAEVGIEKGDLDSVQEYADMLIELTGAEYDLGLKAFSAAQEAKTFKDAIDATKDAASTAWMNIFESIFGNYEQAKVLWTDLAVFLYDALVAPLGRIQEILDAFDDVEGPKRVAEMFKSLGEAVMIISKPIVEAWENVFPYDAVMVGRKLASLISEITEKLKAFVGSAFNEEGELVNEKLIRLRTIIEGLLKVVNTAKNIIFSIAGTIKSTIVPALKTLVDTILDNFENVTRLFGNVNEVEKEFGIIKKAVSNVALYIAGVISRLTPVIKSIANLVRTVIETVVKIFASFRKETDSTLDDFQKRAKFLDNITKIFEGLAAAVDIVAQVVEAAGRVFREVILPPLEELFETVKSIFSEILGGGGEIGEGIKGFRDYADSTDFFYTALKKVANILSGLIQVITFVLNLIKPLAKFVTNFIIKIISYVEKLVGKTKDQEVKIFNLNDALEELKSKLVPIKTVIDKIKNVIKNVWETIKKLFSNIKENIKNIDLGKLLSGGIKAGIGASLIGAFKGIKDFLNGDSGLFKNLKEAAEKVAGFFESIGAAVDAWKQEKKTKSLLEIAGALALMAVALILFVAAVSLEGIDQAFFVIIMMLGLIIGAMYAMQGLNKSVSIAAAAMVEVAAALLVLAIALTAFALIGKLFTTDELGAAFLWMLGVLVVVVAALVVLSELSAKVILAATALAIVSASLIILAVALLAFVAITKLFTEEEMVAGFEALVVVLFIVVAVLAIVSEFALKAVAAAAAITIVAAALIILAGAMLAFTLIAGMKNVEDGLLIMLASMLGIVAALMILSSVALRAIAAAAAILIVAAALVVLAAAMAIFTLLANNDNAWKAVGLMAASLGILLVALLLLAVASPAILLGAAALIAASVALGILAAAIIAFSIALPFLAKGLDALLEVLVNLVAAIIVLVDSAIDVVAKAIIVIGTAIAVLIAELSVAIAFAITSIGIAVINLVDSIIGTIGMAIETLGGAILDVINGFIESIGFAIETFGDAIGGAIATIGEGMQTGIEAVGAGIATAIEGIVSSVGVGLGLGFEAVSVGVASLGEALGGIADGIEEFGDGVRSLQGIKWVATASGIDSLVDAVKGANKKNFKNGSEGINDFVTSMKSMEDLTMGVPLIFSAAIVAVDNFAVSLAESSTKVVTSVKTMLTEVKKVLTEISELFKNAGKASATKFIDGISQSSYKVHNAAYNMAKEGYYAAYEVSKSFYSIGQYAASGYANGITDYAYKIGSAASTLVNVAHEAVMNAQASRSPSKLFMKTGEYVSEGYAIGIADKAGLAEDNAKSMVKTALGSAITMSNAIMESLETYGNPVITPVLDTSSIVREASGIGSLLNGASVPIGLTSAISASRGQMTSGLQNGGESNIKASIDPNELARAINSSNAGSNIEVKVNFEGSLAQLAAVLQPAIVAETNRRGPSFINKR